MTDKYDNRGIPIHNFTSALYEHMMAGMPTVDDQKYAERLLICDVCEYCDKSDDRWVCKLCSCYLKEGKLLPGKARWATQECPIGKWMELPVVQETPKTGCCGH